MISWTTTIGSRRVRFCIISGSIKVRLVMVASDLYTCVCPQVWVHVSVHVSVAVYPCIIVCMHACMCVFMSVCVYMCEMVYV